MAKLSNSTVDQGGATAPRWRREPAADPRVRSAAKGHAIIVELRLPSARGGITDVKLTVGCDDFQHLFEAMVQAGGKHA